MQRTGYSSPIIFQGQRPGPLFLETLSVSNAFPSPEKIRCQSFKFFFQGQQLLVPRQSAPQINPFLTDTLFMRHGVGQKPVVRASLHQQSHALIPFQSLDSCGATMRFIGFVILIAVGLTVAIQT